QKRPGAGDDRMMNRAVFLRHFDPLKPIGKALRDVLLHETFRADPVRISLHRDRSRTDVRQHNRSDGFVVRCQLPFGDPVIREEYFFRVSNQGVSLTTSWAVLSVRMPSNRL